MSGTDEQYKRDALRRHAARAVLLTSGDEVYDQHADPATAPTPPPATTPAPPAPAPEAEPKRPASVINDPERIAAEAADARRAADAQRAAAALRAKAESLTRWSRFWMGAVITISVVITMFGAGNSHAVFLRHDTTDPWAWLPYPALEAALIVEIQIGGLLAEHKQRVPFWGTALRVVTALTAITLCFYGPAEEGDIGGALLHASGPFVQFWLAEFLAHARPRFRAAVDALLDRAAGRERAATDPGAAVPTERAARSRQRSRKTAKAAGKTTAGAAASGRGGDRSRDQGTGGDLVLSPAEKAAFAALRRKGLNPSKRNITTEVRAAQGQIGTARALDLARAWGPVLGGPDLHVVNEKKAE